MQMANRCMKVFSLTSNVFSALGTVLRAFHPLLSKSLQQVSETDATTVSMDSKTKTLSD